MFVFLLGFSFAEQLVKYLIRMWIEYSFVKGCIIGCITTVYVGNLGGSLHCAVIGMAVMFVRFMISILIKRRCMFSKCELIFDGTWFVLKLVDLTTGSNMISVPFTL